MTESEIKYHAYCLAAAFLTVEVQGDGVEEACEGSGHSREDIQRIKESIEQIVTNLASMADHYCKRGV